MTQQKQRKQLILTDNKNISTYRFQSIQRLQPNFMTDGIRNFMYTKHNGDNAKLRIFSFIPQRQRIKTNFMNDSIRTFIHTIQLNTHTTRTTKFCSIHIQTPHKNWPVSYISSITILVHFIDSQKSVLCLLSSFIHFIHESVTFFAAES